MAMIPVPSGVQVWLASGHTDMRKGFDGLAVLVQETLKRNPYNGHLFVFRCGQAAPRCWHRVVEQKISEHWAAEGPADERSHHRLSRGRVPLSSKPKCERFWTLPNFQVA
jgi:transposase